MPSPVRPRTLTPPRMATPPEFLQGTVDLLILRTLAWRPMHGYAMTAFLRDRSRDEIQVEGAALYQALHRLARQKLVKSSWGISETGRRVRTYELTPQGRAHLQSHSTAWRKYASAVTAVLGPA
jgi:PadR family transcriptional regulator, regulatory protein PadR